MALPHIPTVMPAHLNYTLGLVTAYARAHPKAATIATAAITQKAGALLLIPLLGAVGFAPLGGVAAVIQSTMGAPIAAGGWFATCQSIAAGGYGAAALSTASTQVLAAGLGAAGGIAGLGAMMQQAIK